MKFNHGRGEKRTAQKVAKKAKDGNPDLRRLDSVNFASFATFCANCFPSWLKRVFPASSATCDESRGVLFPALSVSLFAQET
ncbi:MAG: hypothetical protein ACREIA_02620, partial [Opitutaceae bacterium]